MTRFRPSSWPKMPRRDLTKSLSHFARACLLAATLSAGAGLVTPNAGYAQSNAGAVTLLADSVVFDGRSLTASGGVEVFYGAARLSATTIVYNQATGALTISGPIEMTQPDGEVVILADAAQLDADLRNGILTSARMVIDQQLQLAAAQIERIDGRYTRLEKTVSSTCTICEENPVPLWQIRAKEIVHDSETRQLYFTDAQLRVFDVPVLYLPRLRLPDPTLKRATGFLTPDIKSSTDLGWGVEIPYFIKLGDHRDLTLTPLLYSRSNTLKLRYRQAFARGNISVSMGVSDDELEPNLRGYAFIKGDWVTRRGFDLGIDLRGTSDITYLLDYGIYDGDRLPSSIRLSRFSAGEAFDAQLLNVKTLRESEVPIQDTLPFLLGTVNYERLLYPDLIPGQITLALSGSGHYRTSNTDVDGMDVLRFGGEADWTHSHVLDMGLRLDADASVGFDAYWIAQNSGFDSQILRSTQAASIKLSYPIARSTNRGARQLIEPIVRVGFANTSGDAIPNSDGVLVELDEGNLFDMSQQPGYDLGVDGATAAYGLRFAHYGAKAEYGFTMGRIIHQNTPVGFSDASGLSDLRSDWLLGGYLNLDGGLSLATRGLFDDSFDVTKWETRLDVTRPRYSLGASHAFVIADLDEGRDTDIHELALDGALRLTPRWTANMEVRHDIEDATTTQAGLGLEFQNECTRFTLGMTRRYADTLALDPVTDYSISIGFGAFGDSMPANTRGRCGLDAF